LRFPCSREVDKRKLIRQAPTQREALVAKRLRHARCRKPPSSVCRANGSNPRSSSLLPTAGFWGEPCLQAQMSLEAKTRHIKMLAMPRQTQLGVKRLAVSCVVTDRKQSQSGTTKRHLFQIGDGASNNRLVAALQSGKPNSPHALAPARLSNFWFSFHS
jgi:hypothetical protein